jgi:hypothetical protein
MVGWQRISGRNFQKSLGLPCASPTATAWRSKMPTREGTMVEGELLKRCTLRHGTFFGSYETAKEALAAFEHYDKVVRPVVDPRQKVRYSIRDGGKEITTADLRGAAKVEG